MSTYLIVPDQHAHYQHDNRRADYLAQFIIDLKPDVVINMGDAADMPSLSDYDKGKRSFVGRSYKADIDAHLEFQERLWGPVKKTKKKMPYRVILEGNHEHRVERALDYSPELAGTIGFSDYDFEHYYHEVVRYDGGLPGIYKSDGILFAHFFPSGISGRPLGGNSPARMMQLKNKVSCVAAHSHTLDLATERNIDGRTVNCLVTGCYQDYVNDWAGPIGRFWRFGVSVLHNVRDGDFDYQWVSLSTLKKVYSEVPDQGEENGRPIEPSFEGLASED